MAYLLFLWIKFIVSAVLVVVAGIKLARYADVVSDKFQLNKVWVGMLLLGVITSLPELAASFSAAVFLNAPNLSFGNIAGSVNFNLIIIVILDVMYRKGAITNKIQPKRAYDFSAEFYGIMASLLVIGLFLASRVQIFHIGHISLGTALIVLAYILGAKIIFSQENNDAEVAPPSKTTNKQDDTKKVIIKLAISAFAVILAGFWLSSVCDKLADHTALGRTFFGTMFLGFVTSLPEIVVSITALKIGSFDLAFGNIFGSNMFNILILAVCDIFYTRGPLITFVSSTHIMMMTLSVILTTILIIGIQSRNKKTIFGVGLDSILMMICFAIGVKLLYHLR